MEMKLSHESICINEVVFNGALEQSVELDYLLPDYCEPIFKVLKCRVIPKITSERIANGKLIIDGMAEIKLFYVSEECYHVRCISQKQSFCKSVEIPDAPDNGVITACADCSYVNCRTVNQHRVDIRGAIAIKATVSVEKTIEVVNGADGMGLQVCGKKIAALGKKLCASKDFSIEEELELSYGKPEISEILDYHASARLTECKIIANKLITKGEITAHILYCTGEQKTPECMESVIMISQVIDMPGVSEEHKCSVTFDVIDAAFDLKQNADGECRIICAKFNIRAKCEANRNCGAQLISDVYSTCYDVGITAKKVKITELIDTIEETHMCKSCLSIPQGELNCVYDISCEFINESCKTENGCIVITGSLCTSVLALDCENMPVLFEKASPCEIRLKAPSPGDDAVFTSSIMITAVSYSLTSEKEIEATAEILICGTMFKNSCYNIISDVTIDESHKKDCCCSAAVKLYFAESGEDTWEIAKRFNTSMDAIISENSLNGRTLNEKCMLIIPM